MTTETKVKRGRPAILSISELAMFQSLYPEIRTRRGYLNKHYELLAFKFLDNHSGTEFICDKSKEKARWGILREIARLCGDDEAKTIKIAEAICERQSVVHFTVREWGKQLREIRISETVSDNTKDTKQRCASR